MDALLERLAAQLGPMEGEPVPLAGGITNRNYRVRFGDGDYVVRVPGKDTDLLGIDRTCEAEATALAHSLGIGPELVANVDGSLVTRFIDGRTLDAHELRARLGEVAAALHALHDSGATLPIRFDALAIVKQYAATASARGVTLPGAYEAALRRLHAMMPDYSPVPCHNDLLASNFLEAEDGRLRIVDWEYAGMGDRRFDLANFALGNGLEDDDALLVAYGSGGSLTAARFASDLREAMWGVVQSTVSDLDFDFVAYAREHFERLAG